MASLRKVDGRWVLQFTGADKRRRTIRLGEMAKRDAESVKSHVEHIVSTSLADGSVSDDTARWLSRLGDWLYDKLAKAGLVSKRESAALAAFVDAYIQSREELAENTVRNLKNSRQKLVDYFGEAKPLHEITKGDADDWRQWMVNQHSDSTVSKAVKHAKHFLELARRKALVRENPFHHLRAGGEHNEARKVFIDQATINRVIDHAPDTEWKLIIALARYGGLRCPSEILKLTWADIDWESGRMTVSSPKTKKQGKPFRVAPLFPELRPLLERAFDEAEEGALHVITRYRGDNANLRTQFVRILKRAGVESWERLFQNLRASRETELANEYPIHVVTAWIGNSERVASKHYLQVTDAHFEQAKGSSGALQNPTCAVSEMAGNALQGKKGDCRETPVFQGISKDCNLLQKSLMPPAGIEPATLGLGNRCSIP